MPPAFRFGRRDGMTLADVPIDGTFLSWGGDANAAAVLAAEIEHYLMEREDEPPADRLDRYVLASSLARQWRALKGDSGFLDYFTTLEAISRDAEQHRKWRGAMEHLQAGGGVHASQPVHALELYSSALQTFETLGDVKGAGRCRGNIGLLLLTHEQFAEAITECTRALELHAALHYDRGCLMHLYNLAAIAQRQENWEEAAGVARLRLPLVLRADPSNAASAAAALGWCELQSGNRENAERAYEDAVAALPRVQTPGAFAGQIEPLQRLAKGLGRLDALQEHLPTVDQDIKRRLNVLNVRSFAASEAILRSFRAACDAGSAQAVYESLATSQAWSSFLFERVLAGHAIAMLTGDDAGRQAWLKDARRFGLAYCRAFLDRGPLDEFALYTTWTTEQHVARAKAYALEVAAIERASVDAAEEALAALGAAFDLHELVGDRRACGAWYPEAVRELQVTSDARRGVHRLMMEAYQAGAGRLRDEEGRVLGDLLALASNEGTTLDVADAHTRLAIHHAQCDRPGQAEAAFREAEQAFRRLEEIGISVREEPGRAHNRLKFAVHLVEFLEQSGRYQEVPYVAIPAVREAGWFIDAFQHPEYAPRAAGYKTRMLYVLSRSYERLGSYEKSLTYAIDLLDWCERIDDTAGAAAAQHAKAAALRALNRLTEALTAALADLELQRQLGDRAEIAVALAMCADLYFDTGDDARAHEAAVQAMEYAGEIARAAQASRDARYVLARLAERRGARGDAVRLYREVLAEEEAAGGPGWISTATALAQQLLEGGDVAEAARVGERAWEAASDVPSLPMRVSAGHVWARCLLASGGADRTTSAIEVLLECCRMAEGMRAEVTDQWARTSLAVSQTAPFELLLSVLVSVIEVDPDPSWKRLAFEIAERAKARALAESIAASAARVQERDAIRFTGITMRPTDPREEITAAGFEDVREMLRRDLGPATSGGAAVGT